MNEENTETWVIAITVAVVSLFPLLGSWWVKRRARQLRPAASPVEHAEYTPSWRSFAIAIATFALGALPILVFILSPKRELASAIVLLALAALFVGLGAVRVWMLRRTRVLIEPGAVIYQNEKSRTLVPVDGIKSVFISAGHIVLERSDGSRVAIPMIFSDNALLYTQLVGVAKSRSAAE